MSNVLATSGLEPIATIDHEWTTVLEIGFSTDIDFIILHNEGESPGFWRTVDSLDNASEPARLAATSVTTIPVPDGLAGGKLQVKRDLITGHLTGLYAWATHTEPTDDEDDDESDDVE